VHSGHPARPQIADVAAADSTIQWTANVTPVDLIREPLQSLLVPSEFLSLQSKLPNAFSLCACIPPANTDHNMRVLCAGHSGDNCSFLQTDASGHTVWMHAPDVASLKQYLQHYSQCKVKSPHNTSMCVLVPQWYARRFKFAKRHMEKLQEYSAGFPLFVQQQDGTFSVLDTSHALEAWYDPSGPLVSARCATAPMASPLFTVHGK
jgi:hypothetical protein